jgi:hypothetical protein
MLPWFILSLWVAFAAAILLAAIVEFILPTATRMEIKIMSTNPLNLRLEFVDASSVVFPSPPAGTIAWTSDRGDVTFTTNPAGDQATASSPTSGIATITGTFTPDGSNPGQPALSASISAELVANQPIAVSMRIVLA